jgi:hypothetical protein
MNNDENITPEDELKAENELLKLKLEMEHGMKHQESSLPPEIENQWLNHVYNFEQQWENAKQTTVYKFLDSPPFKEIGELKEEQVEAELDRLFDIMTGQDVRLDMLAEYPASVIYKFVTEELFNAEIDDMHVEGMMHCFIYEEFHPNHKYDLEGSAQEYADKIFSKRWNIEHSVFTVNETIIFNGHEFPKEEFSAKVLSFQQLHQDIELKNFNITNLQFNLEEQRASVETELDILLKFEKGETKELHQKATFYYKDSDYWTLYKIDMEGLDF